MGRRRPPGILGEGADDVRLRIPGRRSPRSVGAQQLRTRGPHRGCRPPGSRVSHSRQCVGVIARMLRLRRLGFGGSGGRRGGEGGTPSSCRRRPRSFAGIHREIESVRSRIDRASGRKRTDEEPPVGAPPTGRRDDVPAGGARGRVGPHHRSGVPPRPLHHATGRPSAGPHADRPVRLILIIGPGVPRAPSTGDDGRGHGGVG